MMKQLDHSVSTNGTGKIKRSGRDSRRGTRRFKKHRRNRLKRKPGEKITPIKDTHFKGLITYTEIESTV